MLVFHQQILLSFIQFIKQFYWVLDLSTSPEWEKFIKTSPSFWPINKNSQDALLALRIMSQEFKWRYIS